MGNFFGLGRDKPLPSQYGEHQTPVTHDVVLAGWITAFIIIYASFLVILPGYSGRKGLNVAMRITFDLYVGLSIILGLFGQEWEVGRITNVPTPYKPGTGKEIHADIGLHIGVRGINITLKENIENPHQEAPETEKSAIVEHETINYNEQFLWKWRQGRFGFGPRAGLIQREFREAQNRGVPIPILWIAEYFVIDGEGIRFGRRYRTAGWYSHFFLWGAFAAWILMNILMRMVVRRGAQFMVLTGSLMILSNIIWISTRNFTELAIPFGDSEDHILRTHFGFHFWNCLNAGVQSFLAGISLYFLDQKYPHLTTDFFEVDPLLEYEEALVSSNDLKNFRSRGESKKWDTMEMMPSTSQVQGKSDGGQYGLVLRSKRISAFQKFPAIGKSKDFSPNDMA